MIKREKDRNRMCICVKRKKRGGRMGQRNHKERKKKILK